MSYTIKVTAENGQLTVTSDSGAHIPDGSFVINGHEPTGGESTSIGVWLNDPTGRARLYAYAAGDVSKPTTAEQPAPAAQEASV